MQIENHQSKIANRSGQGGKGEEKANGEK